MSDDSAIYVHWCILGMFNESKRLYPAISGLRINPYFMFYRNNLPLRLCTNVVMFFIARRSINTNNNHNDRVDASKFNIELRDYTRSNNIVARIMARDLFHDDTTLFQYLQAFYKVILPQFKPITTRSNVKPSGVAMLTFAFLLPALFTSSIFRNMGTTQQSFTLPSFIWAIASYLKPVLVTTTKGHSGLTAEIGSLSFQQDSNFYNVIMNSVKISTLYRVFVATPYGLLLPRDASVEDSTLMEYHNNKKGSNDFLDTLISQLSEFNHSIESLEFIIAVSEFFLGINSYVSRTISVDTQIVQSSTTTQIGFHKLRNAMVGGTYYIHPFVLKSFSSPFSESILICFLKVFLPKFENQDPTGKWFPTGFHMPQNYDQSIVLDSIDLVSALTLILTIESIIGKRPVARDPNDNVPPGAQDGFPPRPAIPGAGGPRQYSTLTRLPKTRKFGRYCPLNGVEYIIRNPIYFRAGTVFQKLH